MGNKLLERQLLPAAGAVHTLSRGTRTYQYWEYRALKAGPQDRCEGGYESHYAGNVAGQHDL